MSYCRTVLGKKNRNNTGKPLSSVAAETLSFLFGYLSVRSAERLICGSATSLARLRMRTSPTGQQGRPALVNLRANSTSAVQVHHFDPLCSNIDIHIFRHLSSLSIQKNIQILQLIMYFIIILMKIIDLRTEINYSTNHACMNYLFTETYIIERCV
jgi:hypothetical protein